MKLVGDTTSISSPWTESVFKKLEIDDKFLFSFHHNREIRTLSFPGLRYKLSSQSLNSSLQLNSLNRQEGCRDVSTDRDHQYLLGVLSGLATKLQLLFYS